MAIQFACPWCTQTISVDDSKAHERIECPYCNRPVKVPTESTHDLPPPLPLPSQNMEDPQPPINSLIPGGAGFSIRFLARFIDLLYTFILGLIVGVVAVIVLDVLTYFGKVTPELIRRLQEHSFTGMGLLILGTFLYFSVAEGFPGKLSRRAYCVRFGEFV